MTAAMQNVTNEKAPTMKCMQLLLTKFGERKKRQKKKNQNSGQLGRKRSRQITIGHKMSRVRIWTFCQTLDILCYNWTHRILCSFPPNKQSNNKHRQLKQISQECEACTASTESATKTTQKTAETMKHTQAGSTKLKAAAKPKPKHAQQESFQTPQQT